MFRPAGFGRRQLGEWLAVAALVAALVAAAALQGWLGRVDAALYDLSLAWRERPAAKDIAIVGIDDPSLALIGRWPWPRRVHAALVDRLTAAGAAAVVIDLILSEDDAGEPANDRALARAIAANGKVVLPVLHERHSENGLAEVLPIAPFAAAAAGLGHIRRLTDADGSVRRAELWVRTPGLARPHMALAAFGLLFPERYRQMPVDESPLLIPYAGPPGHFAYHSYADVLLGKVAPAELRGKVVFVGATATALSDNFPTPLSGPHVDMPGIEVSATLFDALRSDIRIEATPAPLAAAAAVASVLLLLAALRVSSPHLGLLLSFGHGLAWLLLPLALLLAGGIWLPPAAALAGTAVAYPLWSWRRLVAAQAYMEAEIARLGREAGVAGEVPPPPAVTDPFAQRISDIQAAVDRLRAARRFVQEVVDGLPVGVLVLDDKLRVRLANACAGELLGFMPGAPLGAGLGEILAALKWPAGSEAVRQQAAAGSPGQAKVETAVGRHVLLELASFGEGGRLLTLADITGLHQAQAARDLALRFLSHDMRSPMASILTLLQEGCGGEAGPRIAAHARSALAMADDFTQLGRAEALDEADFTELDLAVVIEDAVDDAWTRARGKGIAIERDLPEEEALVLGDRSVLRRAVFNLLDNAIRYSPPQSAVEVRLQRRGEAWAIEIRDRGYGIAAADLPRLFTPYARFNTPGQPPLPGTGLGLVMVRTAIERHGGRVEASSAPGQGSCFTLFLTRGLQEISN